jgi:formate hydrogenlyase subunit 6/NADH:ubiquinone oxidoreductase subunit I
MRGILEGMGLTFSHLFRPKVTRLYPYEKPKLPPRSRGLIQLIAEEGLKTDYNLKCESCLLCEKACPPRAITIEFEPMHRFKERPWFVSYIREGAEKYTSYKIPPASGASKAGFYENRVSEYSV